MATVNVTSIDLAADGRGHVVADEVVAGEEAEACHYGRGHVAAVGDVASMKVAVQTAASDVAVSLRMRPSEKAGAVADEAMG